MRVALFITCLGDTFFPEAGRATVQVLERLGHEVEFPRRADLLRPDAPEQRLPRTRRSRSRAGWADLFEDARGRRRAVVLVRRHRPRALPRARRPLRRRRPRAPTARSRRARLRAVGAPRPRARRARTSAPRSRTASPTTRRCHSLRLTNVGDGAASSCSAHVRRLDLVELARADECCGFGGTFAIKNADTSAAMLADKVAAVVATGAEVCTALDGSCLLHIERRPLACGHVRSRRPPRRDPRRRRDARSRTRPAASSRTSSCDATSATPRTRSARSARASSPRCPTGRSSARRAVRSRPTCSRGSTSTSLQFEAAAQAAGATVHWARDADEANAVVADVAQTHGAREVVKVKSLTTDEIGLNDALAAQRHPRARDRLRGADPPARRRLVVAHPRPGDPPQPHRDPRPLRADDRPGARPSDDPSRARRGGAASTCASGSCGREVGVSGANFGVAETGHDLRGRVGGQRPHVHDAAAACS